MTDASITDRVTRFADIKSDFKGRQEMVRALIAAGLPSPGDLSARVVDAIRKAGFFQLRGVLVGTEAFQAYAGQLGIKLSGRSLQTQDADFAQFWGISENIGDSTPPMLDVRRDQAKAAKDILQAATLISAHALRRPLELANAWATAWNGGPRWKEKLEAGRERLPEGARTALNDVLARRAEAGRRRKKTKEDAMNSRAFA